MEIFDIVDKKGNLYTLLFRRAGTLHKLYIKFFDYDQYIQVGATIAMHEELVDPNHSGYKTEYYFGAMDEKYGRNITNKDDLDVIIIRVGNEKIYLKRFYG